jgi:hypothetical protein
VVLGEMFLLRFNVRFYDRIYVWFNVRFYVWFM